MKNTFKIWVKARGGATPASKLLGVTRQSVNNWVAGRSSPPYPTALAIVTISRRRGPRVLMGDIFKCRKGITGEGKAHA